MGFGSKLGKLVAARTSSCGAMLASILTRQLELSGEHARAGLRVSFGGWRTFGVAGPLMPTEPTTPAPSPIHVIA